jgi:hypothetical protein
VNKFDDNIELLSMEAMRGTTGVDIYERLSTSLERHKLSWKKLFNVTIKVSPNLTGKN